MASNPGASKPMPNGMGQFFGASEVFNQQVARQMTAVLEALPHLQPGATEVRGQRDGLVFSSPVPPPPSADAPAHAVPSPPGEDASPASEESLYEGTVQVHIRAGGNVREVVHFVRVLCQRTEVRLLRLVSDRFSGATDLWLALREPLPLLEIVGQVAGVREARPGEGSRLEVCLAPETLPAVA
ncbi:hypothetical protein HRbin23_01188 [bacterium HR23]|nr:hypothetical protein HRbin23_01188 [bacterium HR23]